RAITPSRAFGAKAGPQSREQTTLQPFEPERNSATIRSETTVRHGTWEPSRVRESAWWGLPTEPVTQSGSEKSFAAGILPAAMEADRKFRVPVRRRPLTGSVAEIGWNPPLGVRPMLVWSWTPVSQ